jgi:hypothetical protein
VVNILDSIYAKFEGVIEIINGLKLANMKKLILFLNLISLFNWSCTDVNNDINLSENNDIVLESNPIAILKKNDFKISNENAKKQLELYMNYVEPQTRSGCNIQIIDDGKISYPLTSVTRSIGRETIGVYKYVLSSKDSKGFALVCDDLRQPGILAYCPEGSLNDTLFNEGLAQYMRKLPQIISHKIDETMEIWSDQQINKKIANKQLKTLTTRNTIWGGGENLPPDSNDTINGGPIYMPQYDGTRTSGDTTFVFNNFRLYISHIANRDFRVPVNWGQNDPYNKDVPYQCGAGKAPAGCVAVAIAQIMAYHKYPSNYNWDILVQSPTISSTSVTDEARRNEVARLIADIGRKVNMNYDCSGSGATISKANDALKSYGYKTKGVMDYYLFTTIYYECYCDYFNPAYFKGPFYFRGSNSNGEGHAFVVDGIFEYFPVILYDYEEWVNGVKIVSEPRAMLFVIFNTAADFHINWGWNGSSNGYFAQENLDFNDERKLIKVDL